MILPKLLPPFSSFRIDIFNEIFDPGAGWTPLHEACWKNKEEVVKVLLDIERETINNEQKLGERGDVQIPSYNMKSSHGKTPAFYTARGSIMEILLEFNDLEVTTSDGMPLLWRAVESRALTDAIVNDDKLADQYEQMWKDTLPLEKGDMICVPK